MSENPLSSSAPESAPEASHPEESNRVHTKADLESLREEIDSIDDAILDLLIRRTEVVEQVGATKRAAEMVVGKNAGKEAVKGIFLRPAREANILRRLLSRHRGSFPKSAIVRLWRELFSAVVALQGPYSLSVYMPKRGAGYLELARDAFGSYTPATTASSSGQVVKSVIDGEATVGILPMPVFEDLQAWWTNLLSSSANSPRVVARLPFLGPGPGRGDGVEAFAVARIQPEPTGDDRALLAVETTSEASRAGLKTLIEKAALTVREVLDSRDHGPDVRLHLVEVDGFITRDDKRLLQLKSENAGKITFVTVIGAYASPFEGME